MQYGIGVTDHRYGKAFLTTQLFLDNRRANDVCFVLGSQNSSNSQRLRELAEHEGVNSYLIDGAADMDPKWLEGVETVFMTAGASAPEVVVNECIEWLKDRYGASVEPVIVREEHVSFPLPKKLRQLESSK